MPYNLSHDKSLAKQNMTREERRENVLKNKKNRLEVRKLVKEGDTSILDNLQIYKHGKDTPLKIGRDWSYVDMELFDREVIAFMEFCQEKSMVPNWVGLSLWLGTTSSTLSKWKSDPSSPMREILSKCDEIFHNFTQQKALDGQLNPLMYFFMAKNYWGMQDKTEIVHKSQTTQVIDLSEQQRIINTTPGVVIDVEYTEKAQISPVSNENEKEDIDYQSIEKVLLGQNLSDLEDRESSGKVQEKFGESFGKVPSAVGKVPSELGKVPKNDTKMLLKEDKTSILKGYYDDLEPINNQSIDIGQDWDDDL